MLWYSREYQMLVLQQIFFFAIFCRHIFGPIPESNFAIKLAYPSSGDESELWAWSSAFVIRKQFQGVQGLDCLHRQSTKSSSECERADLLLQIFWTKCRMSPSDRINTVSDFASFVRKSRISCLISTTSGFGFRSTFPVSKMLKCFYGGIFRVKF